MEFQKIPTPCEYKLPTLKEFIDSDSSNANVVVPIQKDEFLSMCQNDDGVIHSDIWLIRQQERLGMYSPQDLAQLIATRFAQKQVPNPYAGLSDEELFDTIRPRRFQSPAELKAWFDLLELEHTNIAAQIQQMQEESVINDVDSKNE